MKQLINWKNIIVRALALGLIIALYVLFMNTLIKTAIIKGCEAGFGGRTSISWLKFSLTKAYLNWGGFTIANKKDPWKNLIDIDEIRTKLNGEQLFYKRFVMDEMVVQGIKTGTARSTYGGLPEKKTTKTSNNSMDLKKLAASLEIDPAKALEKTASVGPLASKAEYERVQKDNDQKITETQTKLNNYDVNKELQAIDFTIFNNLDKVKDLAQLQQKLKAIDDLQKQINAVEDNYNTTKTLVDTNLKVVQDNVQSLQKIKDQDMAKIMAKLDMGNYDLMTVGRSMLGPKLNGWLDMGLGWMATAKKYMPPKKEKIKKKDRFKGQTIVFPNNKSLPKFLIRNIAISGEQVSTADVLTYSGSIKNITSEPSLLGKPLTIDIRGGYKKNAQGKLIITGLLDHTKDTALDKVTLFISGYDLNGAQFWDTQTVPLDIVGGRGTIQGEVALQGDALNGKLTFVGTQMKFKSTKDVPQDSLEFIIVSAIQGAPQLTADIGLSGTLDAPQIALSTNLDKLIAAKLNAIVGDKLKAVKKQLEDQYNKEVGAITAQVDQQASAATKQLNAKLAEQQKAIDDKKQELAQKKKDLESQIAEQTAGVSKELNKLKDTVKIPGLKF